jgi:hypothetical protein
MLWGGTAASAIDLHPSSGFTESYGLAIFGDSQIGYGLPTGAPANQNHALLWTGTAQSVVDLNPLGFSRTDGYGITDGIQVGFGFGGWSSGKSHALLWRGTADSVVDLHPSWAGDDSGSSAFAAHGEFQVGNVVVGSFVHPALWKGTAASAIDLNPMGFEGGEALGVWGNIQVGHGRLANSSTTHALAWFGSASSFIDLHEYLVGLPVAFTNSFASGVSSNGTIVGLALDSNFRNYAVMWSPIPEPAGLSLFAAAAVAPILFRRNRLGWFDTRIA